MKEQSNEEWEKLKAKERAMKEEERLFRQAKKLKLKPCPFCGGKAAIIKSGTFSGRYSIGCVMSKGWCIVAPKATYGCGGFVEEIPELVDAWNRRAYE